MDLIMSVILKGEINECSVFFYFFLLNFYIILGYYCTFFPWENIMSDFFKFS